MGRRENKVEKTFNSEIKKLGGITRKWVSPGVDGVPDRIAVLPVKVENMIEYLSTLPPDSEVAFIPMVEMKTIDGPIKPHQVREQLRLSSKRAMVRSVYGHEGVMDLIKELKDMFKL